MSGKTLRTRDGQEPGSLMVQEIVEEVYRETGDLKIREYLENR